MNDHTRAIALALTQRVGWTLINRLLDRFGSLAAILTASTAELREVDGIGAKIAANIRAINLNQIEADLARYGTQGITTVTWTEKGYPPSLNALDDRPIALFWKGSITPADANAVAIVGTREASTEATVL